jgi:hypothetical protein
VLGDSIARATWFVAQSGKADQPERHNRPDWAQVGSEELKKPQPARMAFVQVQSCLPDPECLRESGPAKLLICI